MRWKEIRLNTVSVTLSVTLLMLIYMHAACYKVLVDYSSYRFDIVHSVEMSFSDTSR